MKCAVCGKEFGAGEVCQYCRADKFTALGNYNGYEAPVSGAYNNSNMALASQPKMVTVDSMVCHACSEIIPASSKFCPHCSQSLWVECPKCGKTYSSQYPACSECGTNLNEYIKMQQRLAEEEKRRQEEYFERLHRLAEEKRRQREEKRYQLDEKRRKEEIERKKHEEWLNNTPEGQAEQERIKKKRKRKEQGGCLKALSQLAYMSGGAYLAIGFFFSFISKFEKKMVEQFSFLYIIAIISFVVGFTLFIGYAYLTPEDE